MAKYRITAPSGEVFEVTAPDDASEAEVMAYAKQKFAEQAPPLTPEKSAAVKTGEVLRDIPRQAGLVARSGIRAATALPGMLADAATGVYNTAADAVSPGGFRFQTSRSAVDDLLTRAGLPMPQGSNERVLTDTGEMFLGTGLVTSAADKASRFVKGAKETLTKALASDPVGQGAAAVGAGLAGGSVREAGGGPWEQAGASLIGGVASPFALRGVVNPVVSVTNAVKQKLTPQTVINQQIDQQLDLVLRQRGIDYAGLSERLKQGMRAEAQAAIATNRPLNPDALARLLETQRVPGFQPTRGMLSQDPVQITREKNLAKVGANSTDIGLQRLSGLESSNTSALLRTLDDAGARNAPDAYATGQQSIEALRALNDANQSRIRLLYSNARDTSGRSLPLEGGTFTTRASELLDEAMAGDSLPKSVEARLNSIAKGQYPLTVESAEAFKTRIGKLQRGSNDGNTRYALGLVRQALDETPLQLSATVNPGNLPAIPGTVPPSAQIAGNESIAAFNAARSANRQWMQRIEQTPALNAVVNGIEPDQFVRRFITGQGATVADVRALRTAANESPEALQAIRQHLVSHLRGAATGQADDINKFRAESYNNALNAIGERKLSAFFSADEIAQLRAVGRTANYMLAQPAGTAVNNSNSGALIAAKALDLLDAIAGKLPLGVDTTIQGIIRGSQQRQALNPTQGLLMPKPLPSGASLLGAPAVYSGLLAAQPVNDR